MKVSDKDLYLKIAGHADARTILNMLQINSPYLKDENMKMIILNKYPELLKYKKEDESYREFYIRIVYYVSKMKEEYNYEYSKEDFLVSPKNLYKLLKGYEIFKNFDVRKGAFKKVLTIETYSGLSETFTQYDSDPDVFNHFIQDHISGEALGNNITILPSLRNMIAFKYRIKRLEVRIVSDMIYSVDI